MQFPDDVLRRCWFLAGPTACGKTATSLLLAERLGGEIVSLDSMAIYRGMDIGTAKPGLAERERIPHHVIDLINPDEEFSVADYVAAALASSRGILERGRIPIFVGGTGLYLRGVLRGVFEGPAADQGLRKQLEALEQADSGSLYRRLQAVDVPTAERLHPNDLRRIVRALEVFELTGEPLSAQQSQGPLPPGLRPRNVYWLAPPRDWLHDRINRRVDEMIQSGLVEEVRDLLAAEPPLGKTARQALGYKEIIDHLKGECSLLDAVETLKTRTRQFAKRQHTWFRNLEECRDVPITGGETAGEVADLVLEQPELPGSDE